MRKGQRLMNYLFATYPLIYDEVVASEIDPFYDDAKIPRFLEFLANRGITIMPYTLKKLENNC